MREGEIVKAGYNAIAAEYLRARAKDDEDVRLLADLVRRVPRGSRVLDAGCGAGVPVTLFLSEFFDVDAVDFAAAQLRLARARMPGVQFGCQDMTALAFADATFDAVCCTYAIIHVPRTDHPRVLANFHKVLKPGGFLLVCLGAKDLPGSVEQFHGRPMYWSHFDAATNVAMLEACGFKVLWRRMVADATYSGGSHLFVLAQRL